MPPLPRSTSITTGTSRNGVRPDGSSTALLDDEFSEEDIVHLEAERLRSADRDFLLERRLALGAQQLLGRLGGEELEDGRAGHRDADRLAARLVLAAARERRGLLAVVDDERDRGPQV